MERKPYTIRAVAIFPDWNKLERRFARGKVAYIFPKSLEHWNRSEFLFVNSNLGVPVKCSSLERHWNTGTELERLGSRGIRKVWKYFTTIRKTDNVLG